jgi:predicted nucleic acid-binding protein
MWLLDTDVMIDLLREHAPAIEWVKASREQIILPGYVVMELIQGCRNKAEQEQLEKALAAFAIAWPSPQACDEALSIFAEYYLRHGIGIFDALIGQLAISLNTPLYTFNQKHYAPIPNLKTAQPYSKESSS